MTDKTEKPPVTYSQLNPKVMLMNGGVPLSKPIKMTIYEEDGTEPDRTRTSEDALSALVMGMLQSVPENIEMRTLLQALEAVNRLAEGAAVNTLQQLYALVHDEKLVGHLDHDLLCPAVQNYFDENEVEEPVGAVDGATMLDQLLTAGKKPH